MLKPTVISIALVFFCDVTGNRPDPEGTRRLDKAVGLYRSSKANKIMISGGSLGELKQAPIYLAYLTARKIPREDIIAEDESDTTATNILYSKKKIGMIESGGIEIEKIWLISNFRHLRRINLLMRKYHWRWKSENAPIEIDEKNVSPRFLEFVKLVATIIDPEEKSWFIKKFKEKRARKMSYKGF